VAGCVDPVVAATAVQLDYIGWTIARLLGRCRDQVEGVRTSMSLKCVWS